MRKVFGILLLFILLSSVAHAQYPTDSARVYLITASPGEETYAIFGHSALRVADETQGYDYVFNYGTFDFRTKHFYWKFGTGKLLYFLSVYNYSIHLDEYRENGQALYSQALNLSNKEKNTLITNLQINNLEENKYFRYDFFRDNCATRIRDIIVKSVDGKVVFDSTYAPKHESIRHLFGERLKNEPWTYFGLNLIMGKSTDSIASLNDYMYLPLHLKNLFASAKVVSASGIKNLTDAPVELFPTTIVSEKPSFLSRPGTICFLVFFAFLLFTVWEYRSKRYYKVVDVCLFLLTGMLGILITWLWGWSLHIYVHNNLHIIWASPLNFIAAFLLIAMPAKGWLRYYFVVYAASVLLFIPVSLFITQEIHIASYFLMAMMVVRAVRIYLR